MTRCCVKGCGQVYSPGSLKVNNEYHLMDHSISFHKFPRKKTQRDIWLKAIGKDGCDVPSNAHVCSLHFSQQQLCYIKPNEYRIKDDGYPDKALPLLESTSFQSSRLTVCRFCLITGCKMFSLQSGVLKTCLETIIGLQENHHLDDLPQYLCYICAAYLMKMYNVIEKSMIAQATLLEIYAENFEITKKLVLEQNREKLNLVHTLKSHTTTPCTVYDYVYNDEENVSILVSNKIECDKKEDEKSTRGSSSGGISDFESEVKTKHLNNPSKQSKQDIVECEYLLTETYDEYLVGHDDDISKKHDMFANKNTRKDPHVDYKAMNTRTTNTDEISILEEYIDLDSNESDAGDKSKNENGLYIKDHDYSFVNVDLRGTKDNIAEVVKTAVKENISKKSVRFLTDNIQRIGVKNVMRKSTTTTPSRRLTKKIKIKGKNKSELSLDDFFNIVKISHEEQKQRWQKSCERPSNHLEKYQCTVCSKWIRAEPYLKHVARHDPQYGQYECSICKVRCEKEYFLNRHIEMSHATKYVCKLCPVVVYNLVSAANHRRMKHAEIMSNKCKHCERAFASSTGLRVHMTTMHGITEWDQRPEQHTMITASPAPEAVTMAIYICDACGEQCDTRMQLDTHKRNTHRRRYPVKCTRCGKIMKNRVIQRRHMFKCHPEVCKNRRRSARLGRKEITSIPFRDKLKQDETPTPSRAINVSKRPLQRYVVQLYQETSKGEIFPMCTKDELVKEDPAETYECPICDNVFRTTARLNRHILDVHERRRLQFTEVEDPEQITDYVDSQEGNSEEDMDIDNVTIGKRTGNVRIKKKRNISVTEDSETETCSGADKTSDDDEMLEDPYTEENYDS